MQCQCGLIVNSRNNGSLQCWFMMTPFAPGADLPELPGRCGHVGGGALHAHPHGQGGGGHPVPHPRTRCSAIHVDQTQQPVPYPLLNVLHATSHPVACWVAYQLSAEYLSRVVN